MTPDSLYTLPPEEFVAARDALARELRQAGDDESARDVKALRRPTVAAWAVNLAVRRAPDDLDQLVEVREDLYRVQRRLLSGDRRTDVATLTRRRRDAVETLVAEAEAALADHGRELGTHRDDVRATFEAVLGGEEAETRVRSGRLERPLPAPAGFGTLAGLSAVPEPARSPEPPPDQEGDRAVARLAEARALRDRVAEAADAALHRAHAADREADELATQADTAAAEAARLKREADTAVARAERAKSVEARAREAAQAARHRARRAQEQAADANRQLEEAERSVAALE